MIIRGIYDQMKENGIWTFSYNHELYKSHDESDIVKVIEVGRLGWLGHHFKM
jgi:hypothetical protein